MKKTKKYLLLAIILVLLILFGIQRIVYKQQYKINSYSLAIFVDGEKKDTYPERGNYNVSVDCMGKANGSWDYNNWGPIIKNFNDGSACNIIFTTGKKFNEYIMDAAKTDNSIVYIEQPDTVQTGSNAKEEYRYTGANPNNYVYFGCVSNCTEDNLYRIIGVLPTQSIEGGTYEKRVKLVKNSFYVENESGLYKSCVLSGKTFYGYAWNTTGENAWEKSDLQIKVLNGIYLKSLENYDKYLSAAVWYLGAPDDAGAFKTRTYKASEFYVAERSNSSGVSNGSLNYLGYIGLMYPSDYGYSVTKPFWDAAVTINLNMYLNYSYLASGIYYEWLISPEKSWKYQNENSSYSWNYESGIYNPNTSGVANAGTGYYMGVRPTFYLKENVLYQNGLGTKESPYRITLGES